MPQEIKSRKEQLKSYSKNDLVRYAKELEDLNKFNARRLFKVVVELRKLDPDNALFTDDNKRIFDDDTIIDIDNDLKREDNKKDLTARDAQERWASFIADEIKSLLSEGRIYFSIKNNQPRYLTESDICILVRKKSEVEIIEEKLSEKKIGYSFYKKPGIYQSDEAMSLIYLLKGIASLNDRGAFKKALLTPFFNIKVENL